ncbi:MAG: RagB/SusD family nutrient uptake outer membrane protein [Bacteroidales bacterium]|nr:RagB/SusD family nutrient uptake outer membrane protein [Bacteroidales bacterium]
MKLLNKILILGAGMTAAVTSCDLTSPTLSSFDETVVYSNYTLAEYNVFGIYEVFGHTNCHRGRYLPWYGFNTDIELYNSTTKDEKSDIPRYSMTATNSQLNLANGPYNELMGGVERANLAIQGIRKYGNPEGDAEMAALLGEALCARALLYTEMLKAYGEVPARFEPISPETIYLNKSDKDVIYKQLLADLEEAGRYMRWPGKSAATMTTDRPSLAFAKGLYARIALMASGYSLRPDDGQVGTGNPGSVRLSSDPELSKDVLYPKALAALEDVIEHSGLSLYGSYEQLWRDFNNMDITAGKEVIYVIPSSDSRGRWNYTFAIRNEGSTVWSPTTSNRGGTAGPVPTLFWKYGAKDSRRDVSCANFLFKKASDGKDKQMFSGPNDWYFGKYRFDWMTSVPYTGGNDDGIKPVYMRYSDILLMAAEIANELGNETDAKKWLLEVRARAYKDDTAAAEAYVSSLSGHDAIFNAIVDERALEFVGEMLRKNDLIRWNLLKKKMDESKAELKNFFDRTGDYASFGPAVWYRYAADGITLETYGYERGEVATKDAAPAGDGWICYTNSKGETANYFKFLSDETGGYSESASKKLDSFYNNDPDAKQWWPIPEATLINSQGTLFNDYGF